MVKFIQSCLENLKNTQILKSLPEGKGKKGSCGHWEISGEEAWREARCEVAAVGLAGFTYTSTSL